MNRAGLSALLVGIVAVAAGACDTGDGRSLAPPPPTTTPPPSTEPLVAEPVTYDDGFGDLTFSAADGAGTDLGFAVTLCRWQSEGPAALPTGRPALTVTADGVAEDGDRYTLTLEDIATGGAAEGRLAISFTSGATWRAEAAGGLPPEIEVVEQAAGLVIRSEVEVTEVGPDGTRPLGPATLDLTCL